MPKLPIDIARVQQQKFDRDLRALQRQSSQLNQELTTLPSIPKDSINNPILNCLSESSNSVPNSPPDSPHSFNTPRPDSAVSSSPNSPSITHRIANLASGVSQKETSRRVPLPSLPSSPSDSPRSPCLEPMSKAEETSSVLMHWLMHLKTYLGVCVAAIIMSLLQVFARGFLSICCPSMVVKMRRNLKPF